MFLNSNQTNPLTHHLKMFNSRTFIHYFFIIIILIPYTISDKHNRTNSIQKIRYQEGDYPEPIQRYTGCSSCRLREQIKLRNLEVIKGEILRKMRLQQPPNITGKVLPPVPPHLLAQLDEDTGMQNDQAIPGYSMIEEDDEYHVKTQKIITFAQPYPRLRHKGRDILHFTFSDSVTKFHVSNATLFIFIRGTERRPLPDVFVEVFKVKKITDHAEPAAFNRVFARKITQPLGRGNWEAFDLTETVSEWFKNPRENYGFIINATVNGKRVAVTDVNADRGKKAPFVEISTIEPKRRIRRNIGLNCDETSDETNCCRYPLIVDFEAIGFDFIIAPKKYDAHMCSGDCAFLTLQKYAHTHLTQMSTQNSIPPCCTPRKMSGISMLYFDNQLNVVYGSLPGMVVDKCGCL